MPNRNLHNLLCLVFGNLLYVDVYKQYRNCAFGLGAKFGNKGLKSENGSVSSEHHRRFFRCPAELPIGHLVKFLRCKFNVMNPATHKVTI